MTLKWYLVDVTGLQKKESCFSSRQARSFSPRHTPDLLSDPASLLLNGYGLFFSYGAKWHRLEVFHYHPLTMLRICGAIPPFHHVGSCRAQRHLHIYFTVIGNRNDCQIKTIITASQRVNYNMFCPLNIILDESVSLQRKLFSELHSLFLHPCISTCLAWLLH